MAPNHRSVPKRSVSSSKTLRVCMYVHTYVRTVCTMYVRMCVFFPSLLQIDVFLDTVRPNVYNPQALAKDHPSLQKVHNICMYVCTFVAGPHANLDDTVCAVPECHWHPPVCVLFYRCCTYSTYVGSLCGLQCFMHTLHKTGTHTHISFLTKKCLAQRHHTYFDCHV